MLSKRRSADRFLAAIAACCALFVASCGGGGGGDITAPPTSQKWTGWRFGYWDAAVGQAQATQGKVNFTHVSDDCTCNDPATRQWMEGRQIQLMQEARSYGTGPVMLSLSFLLFDRSQKNYVWRGTDDLAAYKTELDALDLTRSITALYPVDEPDLHGLTDKAMADDVSAIRAVWKTPVHLAVIYSDHGTPGSTAFDWIGTDRYSDGAGVLNELPPLAAGQQWILVPGGADPWRTNPAPFTAFALTHQEVAVIMPFLWQSYPGGAGIQTNGTATEYCVAAAPVTGSLCQ